MLLVFVNIDILDTDNLQCCNELVVLKNRKIKMKKFISALMIGFMVLWVQSASAGRLSSGSSFVFVFKSKDAHTEFLNLYNDGACSSENLVLCLGYFSCIVDSGTQASITDGGFITHDIIVTSGPEIGCRGNVPAEWYHTN